MPPHPGSNPPHLSPAQLFTFGEFREITQKLPHGEIVLAGFYDRVGFAFAPAFMREARLRIAAQWREGDLCEIVRRVESGDLSLDDLITHRLPASAAAEAYPVAFEDPACLKMVLDWRSLS